MQDGLLPDRPLSAEGTESDDQLGFSPLAARIAQAIVSDASSDGLVVGLEGSWGSGKSSLVSLTRRELARLPDNQRPTIIDFRPWLIGNREGLLAALFADFGRATGEIHLRFGDATANSVLAIEHARKELKEFASRLEPASALLGLLSTVNPLFGLLASLLRIGARSAKEKSDGPSVSKLKSKLDKSLAKLPVKIVVLIDDVDRLDPSEVVELLRLVRSVADFSNVVYVLCYDSKILSHAIEVTSKVSDGHAYLEKIVQVSVPVPKPEPFFLRRWFERSLTFLDGASKDQVIARLRTVIDSEGGRILVTPRAVVRALNAVHFSWRALGDRVDVADMVWIQLIRIGNPALYRWIEGYTANMCSMKEGRAQLSVYSKLSELDRLKSITEKDERSFSVIIDDLSEHLLGLSSAAAPEHQIYRDVPEDNWAQVLRDRRLASPEHYRLYFALEAPLLALSEDERAEFAGAASQSGDRLAAVLASWLSTRDATGLSKAEVLLERVRADADSEIDEATSENVLLALSDVLDMGVSPQDFENWLGPGSWRQADRLVPILLSRLDKTRRLAVVKKMFSKGKAIGWLTSLFRTEYFAQGKYGDQKRDESYWTFTGHELEDITRIMIGRFENMGLDAILGLPRPAYTLFAWQQMGQESFSDYVINKVDEPSLFLGVVEALKSMVTSSAGNYWRISEDAASALLTGVPIRERLSRLMSSEDSEIASRAKAAAGLLKKDY